MSLGRPAIRAKEDRTTRLTIARHADLTNLMTRQGVPEDQASSIAFTLVTTHQRRAAIFSGRKLKSLEAWRRYQGGKNA